MHKAKYLILLIILASGCNDKVNIEYEEERVRYVEDIQFDDSIDDPKFSTCNGDDAVRQYFNNSEAIEYEGGKRAILDIFEQQYTTPILSRFNGLIRIRFIVNCEGDTGRFRILPMNYEYNIVSVPNKITDQLLSITKNLNGWQTKYLNDYPQDYYQYLSFKMVNGAIVKILP